MAHWRAVIHQWELIEGAMAERYGVDAHDLFTMSWRRFRTLFARLVSSGILQYEDDKSDEKFDPINDWNALVGKPQVPAAKTISFADYAKRSGLNRTIVNG